MALDRRCIAVCVLRDSRVPEALRLPLHQGTPNARQPYSSIWFSLVRILATDDRSERCAVIVPEAHLSALQDALATTHTGAERSRLLMATRAAANRLHQAIEARTRQVVRDAVRPASGEEPQATMAHCVRSLGVAPQTVHKWVTAPQDELAAVRQDEAVANILYAPFLYSEFERKLSRLHSIDERLAFIAAERSAMTELRDGIERQVNNAVRARLAEGLRTPAVLQELGIDKNRLHLIRKGVKP